MAEDVALLVGGKRYGGWKSVRVTRTIEGIANSFALDVSDRWGALEQPWPIAEEDPCRVEIAGTVVIDGYVDKRSPSASAASRTLSYTGRDRAAALVDCSAVLDRWTFYNVSVPDFAAKLAEPFDVRVSVQAGLELPRVPQLVVSPGDSPYEAIKRALGNSGALIVSDGAGGILITRSGTARATPLVEGQNIREASAEYDGTDRYHRYVIMMQVAGTDEAWGAATAVRVEARDLGVRRTDRVLVIRPDTGYSVADARRRADWEARIRAARSETATIGVRGWTQPDGTLWPLNALVRVRAPYTIGIDGDMLISQAEHTISEAGKVTQLRLVRPDAFTPEPTATVKPATGAAGWKELAGGAL